MLIIVYRHPEKVIIGYMTDTDSSIHTGSEAYTCKQCGNCGVLNDKLGSSETFVCPRCKFSADRDIHAARNILLRHLK